MNKTVMDKVAARELALYIENNRHLYEYCIVPYIQNLHRKRIKGTYDPEKAIPGWERIATYGRKYMKTNF